MNVIYHYNIFTSLSAMIHRSRNTNLTTHHATVHFVAMTSCQLLNVRSCSMTFGRQPTSMYRTLTSAAVLGSWKIPGVILLLEVHHVDNVLVSFMLKQELSRLEFAKSHFSGYTVYRMAAWIEH